MDIVPAWDHLPATLGWKDKICLLTYQSLRLEQQETPLKHLFEPGMYIREMSIPAGTLLTGKEHLLGHVVELVQGSVILFAPDGRHRFDAYAFIQSKPGFHAVVYTLTDVVSRTLHPNPEESRDVESLDKHWFGSGPEVIERGKLLSEMLCQQLSAPPLH